ncbi:MAG TPA: hypothetical protein ENG61_00005 [Candidatus Korarchaeota archaeon]|nr:MAG: hypothetical protein DRO05_04425 [Candidatus Korarchaeota archaeon]HDD68728.1 hypothetical protein [Candidatus Korarchaeota archaeon]
MRKYVDLKVWCLKSNNEGLKNIVRLGNEMGFWAIGLACHPDGLDRVQKMTNALISEGHRVFTSIEVKLQTPQSIKTLSKLLKKKIFLSITPLTLEMARKAVKLGASSIVLPVDRKKLIFDSVCAKELAKQEGAIEIHLVDLLRSDRRKLLRALKMIRLEVKIARKYGIPVIVSSGATKTIELLDPIVMASLAETLLGIPREAALNSISDYPYSIIKKEGLI